MSYLLATHIFLWALLQPERLSATARTTLQSSSGDLWLSPISVWEIAILADKGRLILNGESTEAWLRDALRLSAVREAPLNHEVALHSHSIELPHRDPADRFIAATALVYELTLITADQKLLGCPEIDTLRGE